MNINEVIDILENGSTITSYDKIFLIFAFLFAIATVLMVAISDKASRAITYAVTGWVCFAICFVLGGSNLFGNDKYERSVVSDYVKSIEDTKEYVSDIEKDTIHLSDVYSKNNMDYAVLKVDGSDQRLGDFTVDMKVVYDVNDGERAYVTYKTLHKTLPGFYKKGWIDAELHVTKGLKSFEIDDVVEGTKTRRSVGE